MEFIKAKTILSKVNYGNEWYGVDYNMNLYRGCSHGCIYCDSRSECSQVQKCAK
jgi:DNA repair photolyase